MTKLDDLALELDRRSKELAETERTLEPLEAQYEEFVGDWESSLWNESMHGDTKFPPEKLRLRMAHLAMPREILSAYTTGTAKRKRLEKRIGAVKALVDAQRSILSALKEEMAASR